MNDNSLKFTVRHYLTEDQRDPFLEWFKKLRDPIAKVQILKRINRLAGGNFGDHKPCRDGVWELRIDQGAGYRVYYAQSGAVVVLILCGGDKSSQNEDIERAVRYWKDWQGRGE
ncbi:type II toxin-antitoxin system RelE/ParE family toxin [Massilia sp. W12]|uniref:type II toxin-antitoxin system RelE/ParE family toxin n=1 Tax=Massilia sp. W12 TaxID=3126507 RepID=UPI0030D3AF42